MNINNKIYKNIGIGFLIKPLNILITFFITPVYLKYLGVELYGIWITILSILSWISLCDIGLGNGLKVHLTDRLTQKKFEEAREYISTTYAIITVISLIIFSSISLLFLFFNWNKIFNSYILSNRSLNTLMTINFGLVLLNFILLIVNQLNYSMHESFKVEVRNFISQFLNFLIILIFFKFQIEKSLVLISVVYNLANILVNTISTITVFKKNKILIPSFQYVNKKMIRSLLNLSSQFFIIQIMAILIFTTDNIIISYIFGPDEVTTYSIVLKVFSIGLIFHQVILTPLVPGYTKALSEKNISWIKKILRNLFVLEIILILGVIVLGVKFEVITKLWLGYELKVSKILIFNFGFFVVLSTYSNIHSQLYSGLGKLKFQLGIALCQGIINIPLSIYLAKNLNYGITGVILATNLTLLLGAVPFTFYTRKILKDKEKLIKNHE